MVCGSFKPLKHWIKHHKGPLWDVLEREKQNQLRISQIKFLNAPALVSVQTGWFKISQARKWRVGGGRGWSDDLLPISCMGLMAVLAVTLSQTMADMQVTSLPPLWQSFTKMFTLLGSNLTLAWILTTLRDLSINSHVCYATITCVHDGPRCTASPPSRNLPSQGSLHDNKGTCSFFPSFLGELSLGGRGGSWNVVLRAL